MNSQSWFEEASKFEMPSSRTHEIPDAPTVLVAALDWQVRSGLSALLGSFTINIEWVSSVAEATKVFDAKEISACLCGYWLEDGTFKDLARHIRRSTTKIPMIAVSAPACRNEYRDYLAAMNIGAFEFLCHPYQKSDVERVLRQAVTAHARQNWQRRQADNTRPAAS